MNPLCRTALVLGLVAGAPVAVQADEFVLEGDLSAFYASGNFVVWEPKQSAQGGAVRISMSAATTAKPAQPASSAAKPAQAARPYEVIAESPLMEDGTFRVEGTVETPRRAYFYVLDAVGHEGRRLAPMKGNAFILEPGRLRLHMSRPGQFFVEGGPLNDAVYNSWRRSAPFVEAQAEYQRLVRSVDGETEDERRRRVDEAAAVFDRMLTLETEGRARIATTHSDPFVRRLTLATTWLGGDWMLEAWRGLAALTPDDSWVQEKLASAEERAVKRAKERQRFAVGAGIRDFVANTLHGEPVRLSDVRAESRYVLLEFWASWCGPCRVEIPHMKEAYDRYRDEGFEIVSFTIDDDREDWEIASEEEQLPWPNLGMGRDAEAPLAYNVTGVPKNYLVESSTGEIVAKDLRGHHLDEKLEELLN
ncbi:MAG: TlpA disulfide reductase family protein [Gammaproteobacteria bacterium]|nr:TlpA disulfide reductase family protein [Gammaproteobacteria bacterium]